MDDPNKDLAKYIAIVVRNAMEDFHAEHLSDEQMKELNPIIRNGIYTALHAMLKEDRTEQDNQFMEFNNRLIPDYWEEPVLIEEYTDLFGKKAL
ncbi:hypothetical protein Q4519_10880 [Motilimonas sp. 1_MG-2023]|uniref:hypothetical protein n=1 Tax=Motilimonas sp. 1_MG-2023 TaxID=3062672 RepID=UPI0026E3B664|nr:hypothetical protein [Motilimonas sp. 1_MG-2023]MDO6526185.1 hypothetical protein [Motilimonas sp. 1_MG-2023]